MDDSSTQWVELIAQYGPFALIVFFALPLWAIAKRNVDTATDEETRRYHLRNHRNITWGIFALTFVATVAWGYQQFYIEPSKHDRTSGTAFFCTCSYLRRAGRSRRACPN